MPAVVLSAERDVAPTQGKAPMVDVITAEYDELLDRMQSSDSRSALREAYGASAAELSTAAVAAAKPRASDGETTRGVNARLR
jgi:antitoxin Phd